MAKDFVRHIMNTDNTEPKETNRVGDLLTDEKGNAWIRTKGGAELYHELTDNIKSLTSGTPDILKITNAGKNARKLSVELPEDLQGVKRLGTDTPDSVEIIDVSDEEKKINVTLPTFEDTDTGITELTTDTPNVVKFVNVSDKHKKINVELPKFQDTDTGITELSTDTPDIVKFVDVDDKHKKINIDIPEFNDSGILYLMTDTPDIVKILDYGSRSKKINVELPSFTDTGITSLVTDTDDIVKITDNGSRGKKINVELPEQNNIVLKMYGKKLFNNTYYNDLNDKLYAKNGINGLLLNSLGNATYSMYIDNFIPINLDQSQYKVTLSTNVTFKINDNEQQEIKFLLGTLLNGNNIKVVDVDVKMINLAKQDVIKLDGKINKELTFYDTLVGNNVIKKPRISTYQNSVIIDSFSRMGKPNQSVTAKIDITMFLDV